MDIAFSSPFRLMFFIICIRYVLIRDPTVLDECDIDDSTKEMLLQDIRHRLMPVTAKIRADFEVSCFTYEGIDAVRRALKTGLDFSNEKFTFNVGFIFSTTSTSPLCPFLSKKSAFRLI